MMFRQFIILLSLSISLLAAPRGDALGGARAVLPEGGNPAGLALRGEHVFRLSFESPYAGIGSPLGYGGAAYSHRFRDFSAGLSVGFLQSDMFFDSDVGLGFAKRFGAVATGFRLRLLYDSFRSGNFHYGPTDYPDDPVFSNGYGDLAVTGDIGVVVELHKRLNVGFLAENLADPNRALSNIDESRKGREFSVGASFDLGHAGTIYARTAFSPTAPDGDEVAFGGGFETDALSRMLDLRVGIDNNDAAMGIGIHFPNELPLRFDYTFSYHLSDLRKASTGHGFALVGFIKPKLVLPDLSVDLSADKDTYRLGDSARVSISVQSGRLRAQNVVLAVERGDGSADTLHLGDLQPEKPWNRVVEVVLDKAGERNITAVLDPEDAVRESDESNNRASVKLRSVAPPMLELSATPTMLELREVQFVNQDESIVPVVFFEKGSARVDERFAPLLDLLSERLERNPDVTYTINGYFDPASEEGMEALASERVYAFRDEIVRRAPAAAERVLIGDDAPDRKRIAKTSQYEQYQRWVDQENRRAEVSVDMAAPRFEIESEGFDGSDASRIAKALVDRLRDNPLSMLVVRTSEVGVPLESAISKSLRIRSMLLDKLPKNYAGRVLAGTADDLPKGKTVVFLSGDAIAFRPREVHSALSFEPSILPKCEIALSARSELNIVRWRLYLSKANRGALWDIASGDAAPPKQLSWDWKDPDGGLLPFDEKYDLCFEAEDELGQTASTCLDEEIGTEVTLREERTDKLLLVQFIFDAPSPQSRYLRDRLEKIATDIVKRGAASGVSIDVELQGHTDEIGGHRRNLELSEERANSVLRRLRAYMKAILKIDDDAGLDRWMEENGVSIASKGYAETSPYFLDFWRAGSLNRVVIGDNELPEGRTINRCVIAVIHEVRDKGAEEDE